MQFAVLGAGTWGTTLAMLLGSKGYLGWLWDIDSELLRLLNKQRVHPRLSGKLPESLTVSEDLSYCMGQAEVVLGVTPCGALREACATAAAYYRGQLFISCSKGIEQQTLKLPHQIVRETLGDTSNGRLVSLIGPSHAEEVSRRLPTSVLVAAEELSLANEAREIMQTSEFFVHSSTDMIGVELGGALKNVVAIACGMSDALVGGDNIKAALITVGLGEIMRLGESMGAKTETFFGLAGLGDLVVTCVSNHSRNWSFGHLLGSGLSTQQALEKIGMAVEGLYTVRAAAQLVRLQNIKAPLLLGVAAVLENQLPAKDMLYQTLQA